MHLISVSFDRYETIGIAALIILMQKNELPDSVVVAFLKHTDDKSSGRKKEPISGIYE